MNWDRALAIFLGMMWAVFIVAMFGAFMASVGCTLLELPGCGP